jgi:phage terminase Nu1 subunit (DNA packaging protein)
MDDVISSVDLATLLGMNMTEIPSLIEQGLPYVQVSNKRLFLKSSVISWLRQRELPSKVKGVVPEISGKLQEPRRTKLAFG